MHNADTQCTVGKRGGQRPEKDFLMFKFFLSCHKIWISFHNSNLLVSKLIKRCAYFVKTCGAVHALSCMHSKTYIYVCILKHIYIYIGASLVAQWLRICLPVQGTCVRALVWEDPTCRGAARPVRHNYWACASGACAPQQERPRWWEARAPRWRVAPTCHN